jgi:hypothetical protein
MPLDNHFRQILLMEAWLNFSRTLAGGLETAASTEGEAEEFQKVTGDAKKILTYILTFARMQALHSGEKAQLVRRTETSYPQKPDTSFQAKRLMGVVGISQEPVPRPKEVARLTTSGWKRLGFDFWALVTSLFLAFIVGGLILTTISSLYFTQNLPPKLTFVKDFRLAYSYNTKPLTSGALAGSDWLVLGTQGSGVEAYRKASGTLGLWHTFTKQNLNGLLPDNNVNSVASNQKGVWYVAGDGLAWSDPQLENWQTLIGTENFSAAPEQAKVVASTLSDDKNFLVISTAERSGIYYIPQHRWVGEIAPPNGQVTAASFLGNNRFVLGTTEGLYVYRVGGGKTPFVIVDVTANPAQIAIKKLVRNGQQLLAITEKGGLLGLAADKTEWQWFIRESFFDVPTAGLSNISVVVADSQFLWLASGVSVGRYTLQDHNWETTRPDGSPVLALRAFGGLMWAGTEKGLYSFKAGAWEALDQNGKIGVSQLSVVGNRLWAVTRDNGLGMITSDLKWQRLTGNVPFDPAISPNITDVKIVDSEFWVASSNAGIASYSWVTRNWTPRKTGLLSVNVKKLLVNNNQILALVDNTGGSQVDYSVQQWNGSTWQILTKTPVLDLLSSDGTVWVLQANGELTSLANQTNTNIFFSTVKFDAKSLHFFVSDAEAQRILVTDSQGLLAYHLDTHNWERLSTIPAQNAAGGQSSFLEVTAKGGLFNPNQLLPEAGAGTNLGKLVTATELQDEIWASDGTQLIRYNPSSHSLTKANLADLGIGTGYHIRQVRTINNTIWLIVERPGERPFELFRLESDKQTWTFVSKEAALNQYTYTNNGLAFTGADGSLVLANDSTKQAYFQGSFPGLDNSTRLLKSAKGQILALSPADGVGIYDAGLGSWNVIDLKNSRDLVLTTDNAGNEIGLIGTDNSTYIYNLQAGQATVVAGVTGIKSFAKLGNEIFGLSANSSQLLGWNGKTFSPLLSFISSQTQLTINNQIVSLSKPEKMVANKGQLWVKQGDVVVSYSWQSNKLTPTSYFNLPNGAPDNGELGQVTGELSVFYGTESVCWQLHNTTWEKCPDQQQFIKFNSSVSDSLGHIWQLAPLRVLVTSPHSKDGYFLSDRAGNISLDNNGQLRVQTQDGIWKANFSGAATDWVTRLKDSAGTPPVGSPAETVLNSNDGWTWTLKPDIVGKTDSLTITWNKNNTVKRQFDGDRFADDVATATAFYEGHYWLGTSAGLFSLEISNSKQFTRDLVAGLPPNSVKQLLVTDRGVFVLYEDGVIWYYHSGQKWEQVNEFPPTSPVMNNLGQILFKTTENGIETALMTDEPAPRFIQDQIRGITALGREIFLAGPGGIFKVNITPTKLTTELPQLGQTAETAQFLTANGILYARLGNAPTFSYYKFDGQTWTGIGADQTPFAVGSLVEPRITDAPLRWQRQDENGRLQPVLDLGGITPLIWLNGRLSLDWIMGVVGGNENLLLETGVGPFAYNVTAKTWQLSALPANLNDQTGLEIGQNLAGDRFWLKLDEGKFCQLIITTNRVSCQEVASAREL